MGKVVACLRYFIVEYSKLSEHMEKAAGLTKTPLIEKAIAAGAFEFPRFEQDVAEDVQKIWNFYSRVGKNKSSEPCPVCAHVHVPDPWKRSLSYFHKTVKDTGWSDDDNDDEEEEEEEE